MSGGYVEQTGRILVVWAIPEREELEGQWGRVTGTVPLAGGGFTDRIELESGRTIYGCECFTVPEGAAQAAELAGMDVPAMVGKAKPTYARQSMSKHQYVPPTDERMPREEGE